ncbi:MAG TPA: cytochrome P450 [Acidimicrobiales bacterium]|nr:cytochrome P450 [Acidimicrobiales bacterium]
MAVQTADENIPLESAFNPFDTVFMTDPDAVLARARDEGSIFFSPIMNAWIVTRYDDVVSILRDPELFCSKDILSIIELLSPEVIELFGDEIPMEGTLIGVDPPDHTRLRSVMESSFTPSSVATHGAMIRWACDELVDGFEHGTSADLLSQFSYPLPLRVVALLLGMPKKAMPSLRRGVKDWPDLAIALLMGVPLEQQLEMANNILEMHRMISRLIEERYDRPQNDLLTVIAQGRDQFNLSEREMLSLVPGLFLAGHETLAHELTNVLWRLLSVPERWQALVDDPNLAPQFFEEALRCDPSVYGMWRIATRDTQLLGQTVLADQKLFLVYLAANRDERYYVDANSFMLDRGRVAPNLAFGRGIHHCIGAPLARLEARIALEVLTKRLPGLRLAEGFSPIYQAHPFLRGMAELPVRW